MVLVAHYGPLHKRAFDIGRHGVGIFFVLSGYLITTILLRERERAGCIDLKSFYIRRFFRLMPCAWTLLFALFLFRAIDVRELASCVFFYRNFLTHTTNLITAHFWSLSVEEQFYLTWPWLLVVLTTKRARNAAVAIACVLALYRFIFPPFMPEDPRTWFRADGLLIGCAFALTPRLPKMHPALFWCSAVVVGACAHLFIDGPPFADSILIGWMIHTTAQGGIPLAQKILNWKPMAKVGAMSYSLYVWQTSLSGIPHKTFFGMVATLVILAAFTLLSHTYIENPAKMLGTKLLARHYAATEVAVPA